MPFCQRPLISPIGLDIAPGGVRLIQLDHAGQSPKVRASAEASLPADASLNQITDLVRELIRRNPFRGRRVVAALPRGIVHMRHLRLPLMAETDLPAAIQSEAQRLFPFDPAESQLQHIPTGDLGHGMKAQDVILFAAKHADVDDFITAMSMAGIVLDALDVDSCATFRAVDRLIRKSESPNEVHAILTVGVRQSEIAIGHGSDIKLLRTIGIGIHQFHEVLGRELGLGLEEAQSLRRQLSGGCVDGENDAVRAAACDAMRALVEDLGREIGRCIRYYAVTFRGQAPSILRVTGADVEDAQFLESLNRLLSIPVEVARPALAGIGPAWMVAVGLAIKNLPCTSLPIIAAEVVHA